MSYFVIGDDGQKYGPADIETLNEWARQNRVLPSTALEDAATGMRMNAPEVPGLQFPASPGAFQAPPSYVQYPRSQQATDPRLIQVEAGTHPVALIIVLSILFGGWVGMLINRQITKGLIYGLVVHGVIGLITCGLSFVITYPLTVIDAILVAIKLNRGEAVKEWQFF